MIEKSDTYPEQYRDYLEKIMGSFVPRVLHLENLMNDITSRHFTSGAEGGVLFFYSLTPQVSFKRRIDTFMNMLRSHFNDIYRTYERDLRKLYEIDDYRTDLEHQMEKASENVLDDEDEGVFSRGDGSGKSTLIDKNYQEHEHTLRLCSRVATALKIIQREIIDRAYHSR